MAKEFKRYLVTSALPYANGPVHIGHLAGVYIPSDIYTRYLRLRGPRRDFGLRIGRTRRTHHDQGPQGGRDAPADRGPLPRADQKIVRGAGHVVRHLFEDLVQDPRRDGVGLFPETLRRRQVHRKDINAVLRRGGADLPGRPVYRGDLSQVRQRPRLRRPVREVRLYPFARRTDRPAQRRVGFRTREAGDETLVPAAGSVTRNSSANGFWTGTRSGKRTSTGSARAGSTEVFSRVP